MRIAVPLLLVLCLIPISGCGNSAPITMFEKPDQDYAKIETRQPMSSIAFVLPDAQVKPFLERMQKTMPIRLSWSIVQQIARNVDEMSPGDSRSFRFVGQWQDENAMMDFVVAIEPQSTTLYFFGPRTLIAEVSQPLRRQYMKQMAFAISHM